MAFKPGTKVEIIVDHYQIHGFPRGAVCTVLPDYKHFMDKEDYTDNGLISISLKVGDEERQKYVYFAEARKVDDD